MLRWPEVLNVGIFPAFTKTKKIYYSEWNNLDFRLVDFRANLENGEYDQGIAVRTGKTISGKYYLIVLDFDGWNAVVEWFESWENVVAVSKKTLIEWHLDEGKIHVFLYSTEPILTRKIHIKDSLLEVRCQNEEGIGTPVFVSPSIHLEGNPYMALGIDTIALMEPIDLLRIKEKISRLCSDYMSDEDRNAYDAMLDEPDRILGENCGRHDATKFKIIRYYWKYSGEWLNLTDEERFERAWTWHETHCKPPRTKKEFDEICKWVTKTFRQKRDELHDRVRDERNRVKQESQKHYREHNDNKKSVLNRIHDATIRNTLDADIWTITSESPPKFIVARQKPCYIGRASITYSDSGTSQATRKEHLNYGAILIRLYPLRVVLHESPLDFLEIPPQYTIIFENPSKQEVRISGTIEDIISRLKEMPGYVVSSYGITEALTAIIGAFNDDIKLEVDKSVDFEGYYFNDREIHISRINLDEKHPVRTKEEVIQCIEYLEKRASYQVWKFKDLEVDRRDLLASAIKWAIPGPFNFAMKQLRCPKPFLKGFAMNGERDGGKSGLSEEMLHLHGNPTNEEDADSIYSVSAGSANTEAKFGKAISRTTYPKEISEFARVESYGRNEDLVECYKTAVDGLIVRRGKKDNRNDAPFPSLSPLIINGNPPFSFKGELLKRYHIAKFSEEDRHDRGPNSEFNIFQRENQHLLKVLGDWTVRYILDNRQELLLSKKYNPYQVGEKALEAFYEFVGHELPEWLRSWIIDTSLEELDQDQDSLIRSILYNTVNKTIRENSHLLNLDEIKQTMNMRIQGCLDNQLCPWIRKVRTGNDRYYINGSILELFSNRLPDLTLKKLAEKTGFSYVSSQGKKYILCTKKQLDDFIAAGDEEELKIDG